jgi:hypothetical protein
MTSIARSRPPWLSTWLSEPLARRLQQVLRARWLPAAVLAVTVLAPYHQLLAGRAIPIPDDVFISDLADAEFPARVEAGRIARDGELPVWTPRVLTGFPVILDPLSVALFAALPPALALGALIGILLLVAATGAYALSRHLGASRSGAFLAGFAFAWSGFFVCQLRHLSIIATVACFPWALYCLEQAATGAATDVTAARAVDPRRRLLWLTAFGGVFGLQVLAGFPQSAYISALVYAALIIVRAGWLLQLRRRIPWRGRIEPAAWLAVGALVAVAVGTLVGMAVLLPLQELGGLSDRRAGVTYQWATGISYDPWDVLTFFVPYLNGDVSNMTYRSSGIFWEDYGYVGLVTVLAALLAVAVRIERLVRYRVEMPPPEDQIESHQLGVTFWIVAGVVAYLMVLGRSTLLYQLAFEVLPGLNRFRFSTRFLFVVELAIALLGGVGLSYLQRLIAQQMPAHRRSLVAALVGAVLVCVTVVDLVGHNRRQNPMFDSERWLTAPATASIIQRSGDVGRVYAPGAWRQHIKTFERARGWAGDLTPYYLHRDLLQPNSNLLHGLSTVDAYAGISPHWAVDLIGDHNRAGLLSVLGVVQSDRLRTWPAYFNWLEALSVRWLVSYAPADSDRVELAGVTPYASVYRLTGTLPRARFAPGVRLVPSMEEVQQLSAAGTLDPRQEVVLHDAADMQLVATAQSGAGDAPGEARIVVDRATEVIVETQSARGGLLVLADTYYPGWRATVDGREQPILRANVMQRGVAVPPGTHCVAFQFRSETVRRGWLLTALGVGLLVGSAGLLVFWKSGHSQPPTRGRAAA